MYCTCYSTIWPLPGSPQRTWSLNTLEQKWIEATLKAASIHFVHVWLHLRSRGEPGKRCGATILGIALGAPLEIHHCNSATPAAASVMVCQDRKSFGKKTRVLEAQMYHRYLSCTSCFTQLAANNDFADSSKFQKPCWVNPSSSFWVKYRFPVLGIVRVTSFCRFTFALVPVFDASDSCLPLERGKPHLWRKVIRCETWHRAASPRVKSYHSERLQCFDALFACTWVYSSCAIFAAERST